MRQVSGNLLSYSFRASRIMFFGIFHFLYFYCSSLFYRRLLFKSHQKSISTATRSPLISSAFASRTILTIAAHVLCNLLPLYLSITYRSLYWLVQQSFFKAHHDPPKLLTNSLWRSELCSLLNEQVYSKWHGFFLTLLGLLSYTGAHWPWLFTWISFSIETFLLSSMFL